MDTLYYTTDTLYRTCRITSVLRTRPATVCGHLNGLGPFPAFSVSRESEIRPRPAQGTNVEDITGVILWLEIAAVLQYTQNRLSQPATGSIVAVVSAPSALFTGSARASLNFA